MPRVSLIAYVCVPLLGGGLSGWLLAAPVGPQVANGTASVTRSGNATQIANSPNTILNWQAFGVGRNESVYFLQQNSQSTVLNRVTGGAPSEILGQLGSNGRVFLINPQGVIFGAGAVVDTAGLVVSSLNISDADFLKGNWRFSGNAQAGAVDNQGQLNSRGELWLIAPQVNNSGRLHSDGGRILLAAGQALEVADANYPLVRYQLRGPADTVTQRGQIETVGGAIGLFGSQLTVSGNLNASSARLDSRGRIVLEAADTVLVSGRLQADHALAQGGEIQVTGDKVALLSGASLSATGATGGGHIAVGGGERGQDSNLRNASQTVVQRGALIDASATQHGDGGRVVVWADGNTRFAGEIRAEGGAQAGNGGWVEVSGKQALHFTGQVSTQAPQGRAGTLLLDPGTINIVASDTATPDTGESGGVFSETSTVSEISIPTLKTALTSGNVQITTNGDINWNAPLDINGIGTRTLSLTGINANLAAGISDSNLATVDNLNLSSSMDGQTRFTGGSFNLGPTATFSGGNTLVSGSASVVFNNTASFGTLTMSGPGSSLSFRGGSVSMTTLNSDSAGTALDVSGGSVTVNGSSQLGNTTLNSGSLMLYGGGTLGVGRTLTLNGGTLSAMASVSTHGTVQLTPAVTINGVNLSILSDGTLSGNGTIGGSVSNAGRLSPGNSIGTITINGNYSQASTGSLLMEVASASSYDQLIINSAVAPATLQGSLSLSLLGGYTPAVGTSFPLIAGTSGLSGNFASVNAPTGYTFSFAPATGRANTDAVPPPTVQADVTTWITQSSGLEGTQTPDSGSVGAGDEDVRARLVCRRE